MAAAGTALATWVTADSLFGGGSSSGTADSPYLLLWVLPVAVTAVFLGWYAVRGGRPAAQRVARNGCLGGFLTGGTVFLLFFASPLLLPWDALRGAVAALLYAPLATVVGLLIGVATAGIRARRATPRSARP